MDPKRWGRMRELASIRSNQLLVFQFRGKQETEQNREPNNSIRLWAAETKGVCSHHWAYSAWVGKKSIVLILSSRYTTLFTTTGALLRPSQHLSQMRGLKSSTFNHRSLLCYCHLSYLRHRRSKSSNHNAGATSRDKSFKPGNVHKSNLPRRKLVLRAAKSHHKADSVGHVLTEFSHA